MVEWEHHRGVFPDFTMVFFFLHHGVFSKSAVRKHLEPHLEIVVAPTGIEPVYPKRKKSVRGMYYNRENETYKL